MKGAASEPKTTTAGKKTMLVFGKGCNLTAWREELYTDASMKVGRLASLLKTDGARYRPPAIEDRYDTDDDEPTLMLICVDPALATASPLDPVTEKALADNMKLRVEYQHAVERREARRTARGVALTKARTAAVQKLLDDHPAMWSMMQERCSVGSWNIIKQVPDFREQEVISDPHWLYQAIVRTHLLGVGSGSESMKGAALYALEKKFRDLKMYQRESVEMFKLRFDNLVADMNAAGVTGYDDMRLVICFVDKLDESKYGAFKRDLDNRVADGVSEYPASVSEVYGRLLSRSEMENNRRVEHREMSTTLAAASKKVDKKAEVVASSSKATTSTTKTVGSDSGGGSVRLCHNCGSSSHLWRSKECPERAKGRPKLSKTADLPVNDHDIVELDDECCDDEEAGFFVSSRGNVDNCVYDYPNECGNTIVDVYYHIRTLGQVIGGVVALATLGTMATAMILVWCVCDRLGRIAMMNMIFIPYSDMSVNVMSSMCLSINVKQSLSHLYDLFDTHTVWNTYESLGQPSAGKVYNQQPIEFEGAGGIAAQFLILPYSCLVGVTTTVMLVAGIMMRPVRAIISVVILVMTHVITACARAVAKTLVHVDKITGSKKAREVVKTADTSHRYRDGCIVVDNTCMIDICLTAGEGEDDLFGDNVVLLDTQAGRSIFKSKRLLTEVNKARRTLLMSGVNKDADDLRVTEEGTFKEFGKVYYHEKSLANILSFAELRDMGCVMRYDEKLDVFFVSRSKSSSALVFRRGTSRSSSKRHYICNLERPSAIMLGTVQGNIESYTKREVDSARKARALQERMGYPTTEVAKKMVLSMMNAGVMPGDLDRADLIFGKAVASLKGKTVKRAPMKVIDKPTGVMVQQTQVMHCDVMFVKGLAFLITILDPLEMGFVTYISSRTTKEILSAILLHVSHCKARGFKVSTIRGDGEGAFVEMAEYLAEETIATDISGPGQKVPKIERFIRTVKERVRGYDNTLPFVMCKELLRNCVYFCVSRLNMEPSTLSVSGLSPRELFLGRRLDAKVDLRVGFGEYVQATTPNTDNSMEARTQGCIALYSTGNGQGSVRMYSLSTKKLFVRDQFKILPMPDEVIKILNATASRDGMKRGMNVTVDTWWDGDSEQQPAEVIDTRDMVMNRVSADVDFDGKNQLEYPITVSRREDALGIRGDEVDTAHGDTPGIRGDEQAEIRGEETPYVEALDYQGNADQANYFSNSDETIQPQQFMHAMSPEEGPVSSRTRSAAARINTAQNLFTYSRPRRTNNFLVNPAGMHLADDNTTIAEKEFALTISVKKALVEYGDKALKVIIAELQQMLDKKVWTPTLYSVLTKEAQKAVIRSSMFLKEKFLSTGEFEKLKARLVAGGNMQDKALYEDLSSPTAQTSHVFAVASIAAAEDREVATLDIGGAYLNADMNTGIDVHMKLDKVMTALLIQLKPEYAKFAQQDGTMIVKLDKALYGCVEAALLWYNHLRATLLAMGFEENPHDVCVFNKTDAAGVQCTMVLHVDDILMTSKNTSMIEEAIAGLQKQYQNTTVHRGKVHSYLGMTFDFSIAGEVNITMANFVKILLADCKVSGYARTPCRANIFDIDPNSPRGTPAESDWFHSNVAKMLYLAKRVRPECLQTVAFLTTRVNCCTVEDVAKLKRLLLYICGSQERGIILRPGVGPITLSQLIDAAYGVHADRKSHTGSVLVIGKQGCVHAKSAKQKVVTKSSTEAELIGLSDAANIGIHMRNFLIAQGYRLGPLRIYQDNTSCMTMMKKGKSTSEKSRHIDIRWFWLKERIDSGEIELVYLPTEEMFANVLTKAIQGSQFVYERKCLTGM